MIRYAIVCALALVHLSVPLAAQTLPEPLTDTVSDFAQVLDDAAEAKIAGLLQQTREETGVHVTVATMPAIEAYGGSPGQRLDAYAKGLFNAWGVGDAERNDGILMLVVTDAREVRIALGAGYDAVYDGRASRVLSTAVLPEFREGRLAEGIEAGIRSARVQLIDPWLEGRPVGLTDGFESEGRDWSQAVPIAGFGGVVGLFLWWVLRKARLSRECPKCGEQTLTRTREVIEPATFLSRGTGLEHLLCTSCGFTGRRTYSISRLSSGSRSSAFGASGGSGGGSSGGGFGGGKSSGGGASGKW
ncbi:MAG: TPM domain-containing protein [Tabrizicola sp.]|jgi:uncharacterized protein|nr:TPM domain-containing protein [Tabrizicola sp.]